MTDDRSEDSPAQSSVFGNLPGSRPGTRSPRRDSAKRKAVGSRDRDAREPEAGASTARAKAPAAREGAEHDASAEGAAREEPAPEARGEPGPDEADAEGRGGLEDLAWAGIAAAAEAATIGVRLASRAMEALRGSDRR